MLSRTRDLFKQESLADFPPMLNKSAIRLRKTPLRRLHVLVTVDGVSVISDKMFVTLISVSVIQQLSDTRSKSKCTI